MKKARRKIEIIRLEERVLFDAAAAAAVVEAAEQQNDIQDQQLDQQEQLQEQQKQQEQLQVPQENVEIAGVQNDGNGNVQAESALTAEDSAAADGAEHSELGEAVDAMSDADDVNADMDSDVSDAEALRESIDAAAAEHTDAAIDALVNGEDAEDSEDAIAPAAEDSDVDSVDAQDDSDTLAEEAAGVAPDAENAVETAEHHELAVISNSVPDQDSLIGQLAEGTDVLVLDDNSDVLDQINEYLDSKDYQYDAVHVLSHGGNGYLVLNHTVIDMQTLADDPASFAALGEHLTADGDILLYGCNIASGEDGQAFASQLASLTGADVAASTDTIGMYNWELDYHYGVVDVTAISLSDYRYNLASYEAIVSVNDDFTGKTDDYDYQLSNSGQLQRKLKTGEEYEDVEAVGTLDWTIAQANASVSVADTIILRNSNMTASTTSQLGGGGITFSNLGTTVSTLNFTTSAAFSIGGNGTIQTSGDVSFVFSSAVTYAQGQNVLSGSYTDLVLCGQTISSDTPGFLTLNGELSGSGNVDFDGIAVSAESGSASVRMTTGKITYGEGVSVLGGTYQDLDLEGGNKIASPITLNGKLSGTGDITVGGNIALGAGASVEMKNGTVTYSKDVSFIAGTYDDLVLDGQEITGGLILNGSLSGSGDVAFNGNTVKAAASSTVNMTDGEISYTGNASVLGGTYHDLVLNGKTINSVLTFTGKLSDGSAASSVTIDGVNVTGGADAAVNMTLSGSTVTYTGTAAVLGGTYQNLVLNGSQTITTAKDGFLTLNGTLSGAGDSSITLNSTNVVFGSSAAINMTGGTITWQVGVGVRKGVYHNLVLNSQTIDSSNGGVELNGTLSGIGDVIFDGNTVKAAASSTVNMDGGTITYSGAAAVLGGTYSSLVLNGQTITSEIGTVTLKGKLSGTGNVSFDGSTVSAGSSATVDMADGTITYSGAAAVLEGTYWDLVLNGTQTVSFANGSSVVVKGNLSGSGDSKITFDGDYSGSFTGNSINLTGGSVTYKNGASVKGGTYNNLILSDTGTITVLGNVIVSGTTELAGTLVGHTAGLSMTFGTSNTGSGSFGANGTNYLSAVYSAGKLYSGVYQNLTLKGSFTEVGDLTVYGTFSFDPAASAAGLSGSGEWIFYDVTTLRPSTYTFANTKSVTYHNGGTLFAGSYKNLVVYGTAEVGNITLEGTLSGTGTLTFNGSTTGTSGVTRATGISAVYREGAATVFAGDYVNLTLQGSKTLSVSSIDVSGNLTGEKTVAGAASVISGSSELTVNGKLVGFGDSAKFDYSGKITVDGSDFTVKESTFSGKVVLNGNNIYLDTDTFQDIEINGSNVTLKGVIQNGIISGTGEITIDSGITGSGSFAMDGGSVTYLANSEEVMTGRYYDLTLLAASSGKTISLAVTVDHKLTAASGLIIVSGGKISALEFDVGGEIKIENGGTLTAGSSSETIGQPQLTSINAAVENYGQLEVNRGGYTFVSVTNYEGGNFSVAAERVLSPITLTHFDNYYGATANFESNTKIVELASGWTNYGSLSISNFDYFGFEAGTALALTNATASSLTISGGTYTFNDTLYLYNGGTVTAGTGGTVTFETLDERLGGTLGYATTAGGTMNFNITNGTAVNDGVRGSLTNAGTMNLNTANMHYYGAVKNNGSSASGAYFKINARSTFEAAVSNNYGVITVNSAAAGTVFNGTVDTGSAFYIYGTTTFEKAVSAGGIFDIEAQTIFNNTLDVYINDTISSSVGDANTRFLVRANTTFGGDVTIENSASSVPWNVVFEVYAASRFNGTLTLDGQTGSTHLAQFYIYEGADNSTFNEISILGSGAEFRVYSDNNSFMDKVSNSGLFELNGVNNIGEIDNNSAGYIRLNHGASGSRIGTLNNSGRVAVFAGDNGEATVVSFIGALTNKGVFNLMAEGVSFTNTITNSGTFNVDAKLVYSKALTNSGKFNINADNSVFSGSVTNSGTLTVGQGVSGVQFTGTFTNSADADLYLGGKDTVMSKVLNYSVIHVTGGLDASESTQGNRIDNLTMDTIGQSSLDVSVTGELTLVTVTDSYYGTVPKDEYYLITTTVSESSSSTSSSGTTTTSSSSGSATTTTTVEERKMTDEEVEQYKAGTFPPEDDPDEGISYKVDKRTTYVNGNQPAMAVADGGLLRFDPSVSQTIYSSISVTGDSNIIYDPDKTTFESLSYLDWIMVYKDSDISGYGKYRIMGGSSVTVSGDANGSLFSVMQGGTLTLNGTNVSSLINNGGTVNITGGTYDITLDNEVGTMSVTGGSFTAENDIINAEKGTLEIAGNGMSGITVDNDGTMQISGGSNELEIVNDGSMSVSGANNTIDVLNTQEMSISGSGNTVQGVNNGTIRIAAGADATFSGFSDSASAALVLNGTANFTDQTLNGSFTANSATINGNLTLNGTAAGSNAVFGNKVTYNNGQDVISGSYGTLNAGNSVSTGTVDVAGNADLKSNSGTLTAGGDLTLTTNSGTVNAGGDLTLGTNSGTVNAGGDLTLTTNSSTGAVNVNGNNGVAKIDSNSGNITVAAYDVTLSGNNTADGSVDVNGSAAYNMISDAAAKINVNGNVAIDNANAFSGTITNNGTITLKTKIDAVNGSIANNGTVNANAYKAVDAIFNQIAAGGTLNLNGAADLTGKTIAQGAAVNINSYAVRIGNVLNNGTLAFNVDYTLRSDLEGIGTIVAGSGHTLILTGSSFAGNYQIDGAMNLTADRAELSGEIANNGRITANDADFTGSLVNNGTITANNVDFTGINSGTGSVEAVSAVYSGTAAHIFGGAYDALTVDNDGTLNTGAAVGELNLNGTLATAKGASLTLNGATNGSGTMTGGEGTVVYNGLNQSVYGGTYHNVVFNKAVNPIDGIEITGNAVNNSGVQLEARAVTYSGSEAQQVMAADYGTLTLEGAGVKKMESLGDFNIGNFNINSGNYVEVTGSGSGRWNLDADNINFCNARISDVNAARTYYLDGTNFQGTNNSANWLVFYSGSNVGETAPAMGNANFNALSQYFYQIRQQQLNEHELMSRHLQMESARNVRVGDMVVGDDVALNENYDLVNFDSSWNSVSLAEDEVNEVLNSADAVSDSFDEALAELLK